MNVAASRQEDHIRTATRMIETTTSRAHTASSISSSRTGRFFCLDLYTHLLCPHHPFRIGLRQREVSRHLPCQPLVPAPTNPGNLNVASYQTPTSNDKGKTLDLDCVSAVLRELNSVIKSIIRPPDVASVDWNK